MLFSFLDITNPWVYLRGRTSLSGLDSSAIGIFASLSDVLVTVGCVGALLSIMASGVYLIWSKSPQARQEAKSAIIYRLILVFCICSFTAILGIFKQIADGMF